MTSRCADKISLQEKLASFTETWTPKIVADVDGYGVRVAKIEGDFVWHSHAETDEFFMVLDGAFRMDFRDRSVALSKGDCIVVPRGVEHKPYAAETCAILIFERVDVVNTGDGAATDRTVIAERI